jgi:hypothetical protein
MVLVTGNHFAQAAITELGLSPTAWSVFLSSSIPLTDLIKTIVHQTSSENHIFIRTSATACADLGTAINKIHNTSTTMETRSKRRLQEGELHQSATKRPCQTNTTEPGHQRRRRRQQESFSLTTSATVHHHKPVIKPTLILNGSFLSLPFELRQQIYRLSCDFTSSNFQRCPPPDTRIVLRGKLNHEGTILAATCRQIAREIYSTKLACENRVIKVTEKVCLAEIAKNERARKLLMLATEIHIAVKLPCPDGPGIWSRKSTKRMVEKVFGMTGLQARMLLLSADRVYITASWDHGEGLGRKEDRQGRRERREDWLRKRIHLWTIWFKMASKRSVYVDTDVPGTDRMERYGYPF